MGTIRSLSDKALTVLGLDEFDTTTPPAPASGVRLFARVRGRRTLAVIDPHGVDTQVQPAIFANKVGWITTSAGSAVLSPNGLVAANTAVPTAVTPVTSSFFGGMTRARYSTTATAGAPNGMRATGLAYFLSTTPNMGGFHAVYRFGINASTATSRLFVGLSATPGALAGNVNPSALLNLIGIGSDSADANLQVIHNSGSGTATKTDLGVNFPSKTGATWFYEVTLFAPSGGGSQVFWAIRRLNDGVQVQGGPITLNLPVLGTGLTPHTHLSNGTTAAIASLDVQSIYVETDN